MTVTFSPSLTSDVLSIKKQSPILKWIELSLVITSIAAVIILSSVSLLPAYFLITAKISLIGTIINLLILVSLQTLQTPNNGKEVEVSEEQDMMEKHPLIPCLILPVIEEGIFRGILQAGLQKLFYRIVPFTIIGTLPLPTLLAIGIASLLFGAAHIPNNLKWQPLTTTISGVFNGILFYHYGLAAAILKHTMNNTFVTTLQYLLEKEEKQAHELVKV